ncbi:MAG: LysM peptidoglycan-binding domain-containing protein, partial [Candidatus Tectomicrobia bacterium]|nr:LysM peptidoglycan-binding domain-containing protein [Candidatus Tectomicrobia bacterium]
MTLLVLESAAIDQNSEKLSVVVKEGETIRDIAQAYLNDPNLWKDILRFNGIQDAVTIVPGKILNIPVGKIRRANQNLKAALAEHQRATEAGAKVFARSIIGEAVRLYDVALVQRQDSRWEEAARTAAQAEQKAKAAYVEAMTKREAKAKAVLSYRKRIVHGLRPQDADWRAAETDDFIIEQEKVRTLSEAEAVILFHDESDLRMREFSQVIIRAMRIDLLKQKAKTKVSLVSGNLQALLQGASAKKKFEVDVQGDKGVRIDNESRHFILKHDAASTKLANYDTGQKR